MSSDQEGTHLFWTLSHGHPPEGQAEKYTDSVGRSGASKEAQGQDFPTLGTKTVRTPINIPQDPGLCNHHCDTAAYGWLEKRFWDKVRCSISILLSLSTLKKPLVLGGPLQGGDLPLQQQRSWPDQKAAARGPYWGRSQGQRLSVPPGRTAGGPKRSTSLPRLRVLTS